MFFLLSTVIWIISCSVGESPQNINIDNNLTFYLVDENGNDLLNPENPNSVELDLIRVFYMIDGEKIEVNDSNLEFPRAFRVIPPEGNYDKFLLVLYLNIEDKSSSTTTLFQWTREDIDYFQAEFDRGKNERHVICTKVMWNGQVVFNVSNPEYPEKGRFFIMKK